MDGFFIDNCDVYCYAKTKKNFVGLVKILRNIKSLKKEVIINGGDVFVKKYKSQYGTMKSIMTAVNQESVWSRILFNKSTFGKQPKDVHKYFSNYVKLCKKDGMRVYLLEYTKDKKLISKIKKYCNNNKFKYYISDSIARLIQCVMHIYKSISANYVFIEKRLFQVGNALMRWHISAKSIFFCVQN